MPDQTADNLRGICDAIDHWHWILQDRGGDDPDILEKIRELEERRTAIIRRRLKRWRNGHPVQRAEQIEVEAHPQPVISPPVQAAPLQIPAYAHCPHNLCPHRLVECLRTWGGNVTQASRSLKITRNTLARNLRAIGINRRPKGHAGYQVPAEFSQCPLPLCAVTISKALQQACGTISKAAVIMGVSTELLYKNIRRLGFKKLPGYAGYDHALPPPKEP